MFFKNKNRLKEAYYLGQAARERHLLRVTPYYEDPVADEYWFAGYDGVKLEDVGKETDAKKEKV